jgi:hypothetical protein
VDNANLTVEGARDSAARPSDHVDARTEADLVGPRNVCPWCAGSNKPPFWDPELSAGELSPGHHRVHGSEVY